MNFELKTYKALFITMTAFFMLSSVNAQYRGLSVFDGTNGLKQNTITCIEQDNKGKIWLGTFKGLHSFNGHKMTVFKNEDSKKDLVIRSIFIHQNQLYTGTEDGLFELDSVQNILVLRYEPEENAKYISILDADDKHLYFVLNANGKIMSYHLESKKTEVIYNLAYNLENMTFFVDSGYMFSLYNQKVIRFSFKERTADSIEITLKGSQKMWFTGQHVVISNINSVFVTDKTFSDFQKHPSGKTIDVNQHFNLFRLKEGYAIISDHYRGIHVFNNNHQLIYTINSGQLGFEREFTASNVNSLKQDKYNNFRIGMDGVGLLNIHHNFIHFNQYPAKELKNIWTRCYVETNDTLIIGTFEEGIQLFANNVKTIIPYPKNTFSNIYDMTLQHNTLFCATNLGIWYLDLKNSRWMQMKHPLIQQQRFHQAISIKAGEIIFVSKHLKYLVNYNLAENSISKLGNFENTIEFCYPEKSGCYLHFSIDLTAYYDWTNLNRPQTSYRGFKINDIKRLKNDRLVLVTDYGLHLVNNELKSINTINASNGLIDEHLISVEIINEHVIWCASYSGLHRFDLKTNKVQNFTLKHGLQDNEFNYRASLKLKNGALIFGGIKGSNIFFDEPFSFPNPENKLYLESLENMGKRIEHSEIKPLKLNYDNFALKLVLGITDLNLVNEASFKIGIKSRKTIQWIDIGYYPDFYLQKLTPGEYEILGMVDNGSGEWNSPIKFFSLIIKPPYYKTWWFFLIMAILPSILIGYFIYARGRIKSASLLSELKKQQAIEKTRQQIAEDLHDDLGAELTRISIMSQKIAKQQPELNPIVNEFKNNTLDISRKLKNIVWATYPTPGTVGDLFQKIRDYAESLTGDEACKLHVKIKINTVNTTLPSDFSQDILLLAKEALNNAVKYSKAKNLHLILCFSENQLTMDIIDDGKGFNIAEISGNGLKNIKARTKKVKGKIIIESEKLKGTSIRFACTIRD